MADTGIDPPPDWHWPGDIPNESGGLSPHMGTSMPCTFEEEPPIPQTGTQEAGIPPNPQPEPNKPSNPRTHWPPRTCRICLETVNPTFHPLSESLPEILRATPKPTYDSEDPASGRLLRPCKCKGSSKYVHEGCLQAWRHADPGYGKRNYWQCPTCGFKYRLERMAWGRWISSSATQIVLTVTIFILALFLMGFVADPIINLYIDPFSVFSSPSSLKTKIEPILTDDDVPTWAEHFIKGIASLGVLGFVKVLFALSPIQWWNVRSSGILRGGGGQTVNTGRDRLANISWVVVLIGIGTFLWAVYKGVRAWSRRTLEKAGARVMDVNVDDDDEEEE